jgi:ubiquitin carboxyl-terminal hydrolase MINDY-3/4
LESLSVESAMDLQKVLRISTVISRKDAFDILWANVPLFESPLGAMLFLISALFSRGLVCLCKVLNLLWIMSNAYLNFCLPD